MQMDCEALTGNHDDPGSVEAAGFELITSLSSSSSQMARLIEAS
jgi:hypothetical protein